MEDELIKKGIEEFSGIPSLERGVQFLEALKIQLEDVQGDTRLEKSIKEYGILVPIVFSRRKGELSKAKFPRKNQIKSVDKVIEMIQLFIRYQRDVGGMIISS